MEKTFRPTAVPLITVDPYFSIWSFADKLYDDNTRHWTGRRMAMTGIVSFDGKSLLFCGSETGSDRNYNGRVPTLTQTDLKITPTSSIYTFEHELFTFKLTFTTPILLDDLVLSSRPVSYVRYEVTPKDTAEHNIEVFFDISTEACIESTDQKICFKRTDYSLACGNVEQNPLHRSGDDIRIDWGYLHLCHENAFAFKRPLNKYKHNFCRANIKNADEELEYSFNSNMALALTSKKASDFFAIAYDDIHSVNYFGDILDCYYKTKYSSFDEAVKAALADAYEVFERCEKFDNEFMAQMSAHSESFANIGALCYRQAWASHKLCQDKDGNILFMSKECFSNGCMATLDVTYPSIPLFLALNPELVKGMIRPIARQAFDKSWTFDFAPHDAGQYPLCNGQRYGLLPDGTFDFEKQMPVEECGNFILTVAAVCRAENSDAFAKENAVLMEKYANYLSINGYKPENQLCTDDFAGHLAYNCNLSIKAIVALAAYGKLFNSQKHIDIAKDMANKFIVDAKDEKATRLAFDREGTWSLKYNSVWDKLLGLDLFPAEFYNNEIALYTEKCEKYGVPLDSRKLYTKTDWFMWTTVMTANKEYRELVYSHIAKMICESPQRVPVTDWYDTDDAWAHLFQHRSVIGGIFIPLLDGNYNFCEIK